MSFRKRNVMYSTYSISNRCQIQSAVYVVSNGFWRTTNHYFQCAIKKKQQQPFGKWDFSHLVFSLSLSTCYNPFAYTTNFPRLSRIHNINTNRNNRLNKFVLNEMWLIFVSIDRWFSIFALSTAQWAAIPRILCSMFDKNCEWKWKEFHSE